jgi:ribosomal protein L37AE/L43A
MAEVFEKDCPICGEKDIPQEAEGITVCPKCGHPLRINNG